jgi:hypothetical protein
VYLDLVVYDSEENLRQAEDHKTEDLTLPLLVYNKATEEYSTAHPA